MVQLNGVEYAYRQGMSLKELLDQYNTEHNNSLVFDGFAVLVNRKALNPIQAEERILLDNDKIHIIPLLEGG